MLEWDTLSEVVVDNVLAVFWMDNGPVTMLMTIHEISDTDSYIFELIRNIEKKIENEVRDITDNDNDEVEDEFANKTEEETADEAEEETANIKNKKKN
ncbi:15437_t:CDS:2 [Dentiscutata heterogama]|uniref:15437_t:CDS:1 n=1 Tax=Dentiscutata heterogama TaxID=1316150 RepID=A0ACA9KH51_9GLOM|nr:15437_t:CDS:2 [Dentiscutata heterogama]